MRTQLDDEILSISDWRLREFCRQALDGVPNSFFEVAASSTGKYHPKQSQGQGGLVRHTKMACYFGKRLTRVYGLSDTETDIVIAALVLHDIGKAWEDRSVSWEDRVPHDILGPEYLKTLPEAYRFKLVIEGVRWHMGPWSSGKPNFYTDLSPLCQVIHLGDYVAAQKSLLVDFL